MTRTQENAAISPASRPDRGNDPPHQKPAEGELYLFHRSDRRCPPIGSLWGIFHKRIGATTYIEWSSRDLHSFLPCQAVPKRYVHSRPATRAERCIYMRSLSQFQSLGSPEHG